MKYIKLFEGFMGGHGEPHYSMSTLLKKQMKKYKEDIGYFYVQLAGEAARGKYQNDIIYIGYDKRGEGGSGKDKRINIICDEFEDTYKICKGDELLKKDPNIKSIIKYLLHII